jgi:hypothetical protein
MKPLPEDQIDQTNLAAATEALRKLDLSELHSQSARLLKQVNELPQRMSQLAADSDDYAAKLKGAVLLNTLTGTAQHDLRKLEMLAEQVSLERRQARVDLARATAMLQLVEKEIQTRAEHDQYQAILKATPGLKADFGASCLELQQVLSKTIALMCVLQPGLRPESMSVAAFVAQHCPRVVDDAQAFVRDIKGKALASFIERRDTEAAWLSNAKETLNKSSSSRYYCLRRAERD